ncbi:MAG: polysaccharide biosynthesis tyrosine autokinase [Muribaculaceae bacterium]|nr:polysaccharide biosynthesis tyrosine autokinase [Muribaculaceae bacterium]
MAQNNHSDFINISQLLKNYLSKWYLFLISIIVCMLLGLLVIRIHKVKYGVRANILIQQESATSPLDMMGGLGDIFGASGHTDDEIFVLSSHSVYRDVVRDLGLNRTHYIHTGFLNNVLTYPNYPIDVTMPEAVADTLSKSLRFNIKINEAGKANITVKESKLGTLTKIKDVSLPYTVKTIFGDYTVEPTSFYVPGTELDTRVLVTGYHSAAEDYALDISSEIANKRSNVILMGYNTTCPKLGEMLLQDIIDKYNQRGIYEKNVQGKQTGQFIDERLRLLADDLSDSEAKYQSYLERQGIVDPTVEVQYQTEKRANVEASLIEAETSLEILRITKEFLALPANRYELIPTAVSSEALQRTISEYNTLLIERNDLASHADASNIALQRKTAAIDAARNNIIASVDKQFVNQEVLVRDLKAQMAATGNRLGSVPSQSRAVIDMKRQLEVKQELYVFLRKRQEENAMMMANATPKAQIVDVPYTLKKPLGITNKMILALAFIFGFCIPPVYLYVLKLFRNRVENREEIESRTQTPILSEMCIDHSGRSLVVSPTDLSSATELFRLMRANLLFVFNDPKDKVVLTTSTTSGEGKSFICINLAASLALLGKKVLLVGMDIRAPKLSSYLDLAPGLGLTQYLSSSEISIEQIINKKPLADFPTLDIIVAGPIPPNPAELLISNKVDEMFSILRQRYDYIVVDSAPVGMVSDSFALNRIADATIYVTRINHTSLADIDYIDEIYQDKRLKKLSLVVNGVKSKKTYGYSKDKRALDH